MAIDIESPGGDEAALKAALQTLVLNAPCDVEADFPTGYPLRDYGYFNPSTTFVMAKADITAAQGAAFGFLGSFNAATGTQLGVTSYVEQRGGASLFAFDGQGLPCPAVGVTINRISTYEAYCEKAGAGTVNRMSGFWAESSYVGAGNVVVSCAFGANDQTIYPDNIDNNYFLYYCKGGEPPSLGTWFNVDDVGNLYTEGVVRTLPVALASLPTASDAGMGARAFITDGSTTLALGIGATAAGGGSNKVPVYSDGTNWRLG